MRNNRLRDGDVFDPSSTINTLEPDRDFGREPQHESVAYTYMGWQDKVNALGEPIINDPNDDRALAKVVFVNKNITRYYVKVNALNHLFNPIGIAYENSHNKIRYRIGDKEWKYKEVNHKCFDYYLAFLKTKNVAYHKNAERELV